MCLCGGYGDGGRDGSGGSRNLPPLEHVNRTLAQQLNYCQSRRRRWLCVAVIMIFPEVYDYSGYSYSSLVR